MIVPKHGRMYDTLFYAGGMVSSYNLETTIIQPRLDWALVDVTQIKPKVEDEPMLELIQE